MMARTVETALVRIFDTVGQVHGTGFLVDDCHVLTCAHVIEAAVGADLHSLDSGNIASAITKYPVSLDFPFAPSGTPYSAGNRCPVQIACWKPVPPEVATPTNFQEDIALLTLDPGPPGSAQPLRLSAAIPQDRFEGKEGKAYGVPSGDPGGRFGWAVVGEQLGNDLWQLDRSLDSTGYPITQGFSGAAFWVPAAHHVVGMVVAADHPGRTDTQNARFLPTSYLIRTLPHLPWYAYVENPYRGLEVFDEAHQEFFFGREAEAQELATRVGARRLEVVAGPSGSGKSSLVRAGLLPLLKKDGSWSVGGPIRLGSDPLFALAVALVDPSLSGEERVARANEVADSLGQNAARWPLILSTLLQSRLQGKRLLIVIDQFEELWTLCKSTETQRLVLDGLVALINRDSNPSLPITVLLAMRSDYLIVARGHPPFREALDHDDALFRVRSMDDAQLRAAIEKPAIPLGVRFDPAVIDAMRDAMEGEPGNLPLLELALKLLWDRNQDDEIAVEEYQDIGTVEGALDQHADQVLARLSSAEQDQAEHILIQLVQPGEGAPDTRRVATEAEVGQGNWEVVAKLAADDARLVVTEQRESRESGAERTVELAHEALIWGWDRLRTWMAAETENRAFRVWQEDLRRRMRDWQSSQRDEDLLKGARLEDAEDWLQQRGEELPLQERQFIGKSVARRRLGASVKWGAVGTVLLLLLGALLVVRSQQLHAEQQQHLAQTEKNLAQAHALADRALVWLSADPAASIPLSVRAVKLADDAETEGALRQTIVQAREVSEATVPEYFGGPDEAFITATLCPDGRNAGAVDSGSGWLWNPTSNKATYQATGEDVLTEAALSADCRYIATQGFAPGVWSTITRKRVAILPHDTGLSPAFSYDDRLIGDCGLDGHLRVWRVDGGKLSMNASPKPWCARLIAFGHLGHFLLESTQGNDSGEGLVVRDTNTGKLLTFIRSKIGALTDVQLSGNDQLLAAVSDRGLVNLWDIATGELRHSFVASTTRLNTVAFSHSGQLVAAAGDDRLIRIWNVDTGTLLATLGGHTGAINSVAFSPDDGRLISGSDDTTVRIWDTATGQEDLVLRGHTGPVTTASFGASGRRAISAGRDGTIRVWDVSLLGRVSHRLCSACDLANEIVNDDGSWTLDTVRQRPSGRVHLEVWKTTLHATRPLYRIDGDFSQAVLSPTNSEVLTIDRHGYARLWGVHSEGGAIQVPGGEYREGIFNPSGSRAALLSASAVNLVSSSTGALIERFSLPSSRRGSNYDRLAFGPKGDTVAFGGDNGQGTVWRVSPKRILGTVMPSGVLTQPYVLSPDGRESLVAFDDKQGNGHVAVLDTATGKLRFQFRAHSSALNALTFSPDGHLIATSAGDFTARIWNSRSGSQIATLREPVKDVFNIGFSPDSHVIAVSALGTDARLYDALTGALLQVIPSGKVIDYYARFSKSGDRILLEAPNSQAMVASCRECGTTAKLMSVATRNLPTHINLGR